MTINTAIMQCFYAPQRDDLVSVAAAVPSWPALCIDRVIITNRVYRAETYSVSTNTQTHCGLMRSYHGSDLQSQVRSAGCANITRLWLREIH